MKIDTTNWEEFRVGDLFEAITKTALNSFTKRDEKIDDYVIPALSSTVDNHSFGYYVKSKDHNVIDRLCLSVTSNGDAGKVYLQNQPFAIAQDAYAIYLKDDDRENIYLFIAAVLEKLLIQKYNYNNKAGWNKVKKEVILLPAIDPDTPDFDYMEEYIEEIKFKYIDKLEKDNDLNIDKALEVTGLSYEDLDKDLVVEAADRYEEFRVGDLFEAITKTALGSFTKRSKKTDNYIVPALSSTVNNHSLGYYVKEKDHKIIDRVCLSVTSNGDAGKVYLQNKPFTIAQDAYAIYLKDDGRENVYLFIATVLEKLLIQKYNYTNKAGWTKVQNEVISLPAIDCDTPDFDYMEKAIYIYTAKKIKLEKLSNEKEIELLRRVI